MRVPIAGRLVTVVVLVWLVRRVFVVITVRGGSMAPTFVEGDRLLAVRTGPWLLRPGRVVVGQLAPATSRMYVKRVLALGHGVVEIPLDALSHPLVARLRDRADADGMLRWHVPPGHVFVKGDHAGSADSVVWGPVPASQVLGVVLGRLASPQP